MFGNSTTGIIDILLNQNTLTPEKVTQARNEALSRQIPIENILLEKGWVSQLDIIKAKSVLYGIPFIDVNTLEISKEIAQLSNEEESTRFKILIFENESNNLKAAMSNPLDIQTIRYFEQKLGGRIQVYIAQEQDLLNKIKTSFKNNVSSEVSSVVQEAVSASDFVDISEGGADNLDSIDISSAPVAKILNLLLDSAVQDKASDIHIEPQADHIRVRFRLNGILRETLSLPTQVGPSLVSRIKILSRMAIDEKRKPLDGRFQIKAGEQEIDLRVSSLPTVLGEKVVIRLLRKDLGILSLEDTGLRGPSLKTFNEGLKATAGIILVTGPTGSGKTVTVATSMYMLNKPEVNIVSIEDPVEIKIPGVNQVQVNEDAGLTFASALRSFLRQDPNIISVGEIRDRETAALAAQASLTGHLVISTLHTNSAAGALPRLLDMGIEPYIIASSVNVCLAQRLCRRICRDCVYAYIPEESESIELSKVLNGLGSFDLQKYAEFQKTSILKDIKIQNTSEDESAKADSGIDLEGGLDYLTNPASENQEVPQLYLFKGAGCDKCGGTGYAGRVGIFEVFRVTEKIGSLVMQHKAADEIEKEACASGMIRMIQDGFLKSLEGMTTLEEVLRVIHS
jgi:type IV pilus assembly protein PilB